MCGDGILSQRGIDQDHYNTLKSHFKGYSNPITYDDLSKTYLSQVLHTNDIKSFERAVSSIPAGSEDLLFSSQDICFSRLNLLKNNLEMTTEEKNFVDFFITPFMRPTVNTMGELYTYESRECFLKSINTIWKNSGIIRSTSEGFKADGIVRYKDLEIMLVEVCGVYGNVAMSKTQFDRHKGLYACLAMLRTIAVKYKSASLATFQNLQILFLHT
ncbi:hypothetical protein [Parasitella parasitica]|uniref:Uncharacterized protein n=1 Tax=Parasitella parasitica TaxID=35722 RepID=A0A0B7NJB0_9FUNG|nr:hypothetical protein [Parasitella parasitica]